MFTGRRCGLDSSFLLEGSAVMSSRLLLRRDPEGRTFSFPDESGCFSSALQFASTALSSWEDRGSVWSPRLPDPGRNGTGCVDAGGTSVASLVCCAFSVKGSFGSSLGSPRRRFLNGQIGIVYNVRAQCFTCRLQDFWRAAGWILEDSKSQKEEQRGTKSRVKAWKTV